MQAKGALIRIKRQWQKRMAWILRGFQAGTECRQCLRIVGRGRHPACPNRHGQSLQYQRRRHQQGDLRSRRQPVGGQDEAAEQWLALASHGLRLTLQVRHCMWIRGVGGQRCTNRCFTAACIIVNVILLHNTIGG